MPTKSGVLFSYISGRIGQHVICNRNSSIQIHPYKSHNHSRSPFQLAQRKAYKAAVNSWNSLPNSEKLSLVTNYKGSGSAFSHYVSNYVKANPALKLVTIQFIYTWQMIQMHSNCLIATLADISKYYKLYSLLIEVDSSGVNYNPTVSSPFISEKSSNHAVSQIIPNSAIRGVNKVYFHKFDQEADLFHMPLNNLPCSLYFLSNSIIAQGQALYRITLCYSIQVR
jgi:hypothetical protein